MSNKIVRTICQQCYNFCGVLMHVQDGVITKIEGDPDHPLNRGQKTAHICPKGSNAYRYTYSPKRIKYPAKKTADGNWERIAWKEAIDIIADNIYRVGKEYGPEAFVGFGTEPFFDSGTFWKLFLAQIGSPHLTYYGDFCGATTQLADVLTVGERFTRYPYGPDVTHSKLIVVIASNPLISHPNQWIGMVNSLKKGAQLIVVDPRYTETASKANVWIQIKPGSDAALGLAMLNVIINEEIYDKEFVENWCIGFDKLKDHIKEFTPKWAEEKTWVSADIIRKIARMYATIKPAALIRRIGTAHHQNSTQTARIFTILIAITGNIDVPGGNLLIKNYKGLLPPTEFFHAKAEWKELFSEELLSKQFGSKQFPFYSGPKAFNKIDSNTATIKAMNRGDVKSVLAIQTNPICSYPNSREVAEGFKKLEFFAVASHTYTPTAALADVILPLSHWPQDYSLIVDLYSKCISAGVPAIEPIGESKPATQILLELTKIMVQKGFIKNRYIVWDRIEDFYDDRLKGTGLTFNELREKVTISYSFEYKEYEKRGFATPSGKVELYSDLMERMGIDPLPKYIDLDHITSDQFAKEYPLILITGARERYHYLTKHRELAWARKLSPFPKLQVNPETAMDLGISDGDWIYIETPWGIKRCMMKAKFTPRMHPKVVHAPFGWYYPEKEDLGAFESNINSILSNDAPYDPIVGIPTLKPVVCRIKKAEGIQDWNFVEGLNKIFQV